MEYLFRLNNSFIISEKYSIILETSIDIVTAYEFKNSEAENLYQVLRNNASVETVDFFLEAIPITVDEKSDKFRVVSSYIYTLRCNIAHLRYNQDRISDVGWTKCVKALIDIIYSIYQKSDEDIICICSKRLTWYPILWV